MGKEILKATARMAVAILLVFISSVSAMAQTVTVSPKTGHLIAAATAEGESGFENGLSGMWVHNQLPLTMVTSDITNLTESGLLKVHAGNMIAAASQPDGITLCGVNNAYFCLSLPKGYRFSSYTMILQDKYTQFSQLANNTSLYIGRDDWTFGEYDSRFTDRFDEAGFVQIAPESTPNTSKEYKLSRTGQDMGNVLYFKLTGGSNNNKTLKLAALYIKLLSVTYEVDNAFTSTIAPVATFQTPKSVAGNVLNTGFLDLGPITQNTKNSKTFLSYQWSNVKDLAGKSLLYDEKAVSNGKTDASAGNKNIYGVADSEQKLWYGLKNGIYYVETPVSANETGPTADGIEVPVGYRITGAKINYRYGDAYNNTYQTTTEKEYLIRYQYYGQDYYLYTDGSTVSFKASTDVTAQRWTWGSYTDNYGYTKYYLATKIGNTWYYLYDTDNGLTVSTNYASNIMISQDGTVYYYYVDYYGNYIYYYLTVTKTGNESCPACFNTYTEAAELGIGVAYHYSATDIASTSKITSASSFTLTAYDKTGTTAEATVTASSDNAGSSDGAYIDLTGLNNDAIKFQISDLADDALAMVRIELTLEALDPYADSYSVIATLNEADHKQTISQQFVASDFATGGEVNTFNVPADFAGKELSLSFNTLRSKHADQTYGPYSGDGNVRYCYVKSNYFNTINEDPYGNASYVADHDYEDKIAVGVAGDKPFKFNNASELTNSSTTSDTKYLERYHFSLANYTNGGGTFKSWTISESSPQQIVYLVTKDETRYNIAPTTATHHEYFAFYKTNVVLKAKTYTPKMAYTKIYDTTFRLVEGGTSGYTDTTPFVGVSVGVSEALPAGSKGFLTVKSIKEKLESDIKSKATGAPADLEHIIYIDASGLSSVIVGDGVYGEISDLSTAIAKNALIYLPYGAAVYDNNCAHQLSNVTTDKSFVATANIILQDKEPFYAPFDIAIDANNYARYTRDISKVGYARSKYSAICLPFRLNNLVDGQFKSDYADVTVLKMNEVNCLLRSCSTYDASACYSPASESSFMEANTPCIIRLDDNTKVALKETEDYIIQEKGALIKATPSQEKEFSPEGSVSTGQFDNQTYTFTHYATLAGCQVDRNDQNPIYYMANSSFHASCNLNNIYKTVKVYPFRTYYKVQTNAAKLQLQTMDITIGEGDEGQTTGISDIGNGSDNSYIRTAHNSITITAPEAGNYKVATIAGNTIYSGSLTSGEEHTLTVLAGIYIVNGTKVIVP